MSNGSSTNAGQEQPTRLANLSGFQRDILWILSHQEPLKGLAIKTQLRAYYGEHVNHGRLYPNLDKLVDWGFVDKGKRDDRTNDYTLTAAGQRALERRRQWIETGEIDAE